MSHWGLKHSIILAAMSCLVLHPVVWARQYSCAEAGKMRPISYDIGHRGHSETNPAELYLSISIKETDVYDEALVRLGCSLNEAFPQNKILMVRVFTSRAAAKRFVGHPDSSHYGEDLWTLRAFYLLDRVHRRQYVEFLYPEKEGELLAPKRIKIDIPLDELHGIAVQK
jgi:hypothetical protein